MKKMHRSEFLKEVKVRFPETVTEINQQDGLLSFEIDVFFSLIQNKINSRDIAKTEEAFLLLDKYYRNGNKSLHALIRNAVCEDLDFSDTKAGKRVWAYEILPNALKEERKAWVAFMGRKSLSLSI